MERSMLSGKSFLLIYWPRIRLKGPKSFFIHDSLNHLFFSINKNFLCIWPDKLRSIHYHHYDYDAPIDEYGRQVLVMPNFVLQLKSVWGLGTPIPHFFFPSSSWKICLLGCNEHYKTSMLQLSFHNQKVRNFCKSVFVFSPFIWNNFVLHNHWSAYFDIGLT